MLAKVFLETWAGVSGACVTRELRAAAPLRTRGLVWEGRCAGCTRLVFVRLKNAIFSPETLRFCQKFFKTTD